MIKNETASSDFIPCTWGGMETTASIHGRTKGNMNKPAACTQQEKTEKNTCYKKRPDARQQEIPKASATVVSQSNQDGIRVLDSKRIQRSTWCSKVNMIQFKHEAALTP